MIKVAGIDHVGIGTDFDGGGGLQGCRGDNDLINLTIKMIEKGYTEEDLRKIWGGNLLRVMKQVQEAPLLSSKNADNTQTRIIKIYRNILLSFFGNYQGCLTNGQPLFVTYSLIVKEIRQTLFPSPHHRNFPITNRETLLYK